MNKLYGLVLAGGKSTRMGENKALMEIEGGPQYLKAIHTLAPFCEEVFVSCGEQQSVFTEEVSLIPDGDRGRGPAAGLLSAHQSSPFDDWLVLPCDLPFMDSTEIRLLLAKASHSFEAILFEGDKKNPTAGIWRASALTQLECLGSSVGWALHRVVEQLNAKWIKPKNDLALFNMNTPLDYRKACFEI